MNNMRILVGITAYGGSLKLGCAKSLFQLQQFFQEAGIAHAMAPVAINGTSAARNYLASVALAGDFSHLLFVDWDMEFAPSAVRRLIEAGRPVIGVDYPKRRVDLQRLAAESKTRSFKVALARAHEFMVSVSDNFVPPADGLAEYPVIGMGLTLISRSALERMAATGKLRQHNAHRFRNMGLSGSLYGFFDLLFRADGEEVSEDFSFCLRWRELCGGTVWAVVDEPVGHIGEFTYRSSIADTVGD